MVKDELRYLERNNIATNLEDYYQILANEEVWMSLNGEVTKIKDLEDPHLENIIAMLMRFGSEQSQPLLMKLKDEAKLRNINVFNEEESKQVLLKVEIAELFAIELNTLTDYDILIWNYCQDNFEGEAFVLLMHKETNKLYEVNASHCSCYGLEDQFVLEPVTISELRFRIMNSKDYGYTSDPDQGFRKELIAILKDLDK